MKRFDYLFYMTLWATLLPGLIVLFLLLVLLCLTIYGAIIGIPLMFLDGYIIHRIFKSLGKSQARFLEGEIPERLSERILPFFLPVFYILAILSVGLLLFPEDQSRFNILAMVMVPQYIGWTLPFSGLAIFFQSFSHTILLAPLGVQVLTAVIGCFYVLTFKPTPKRIAGGTVLFASSTLVFASVPILISWNIERTVLPPSYETVNSGRFSSIDETDLKPYEPFTGSPKLVRIDYPNLMVSTNHPRLHGALGFYPVYASMVESTYLNFGTNQFETHLRSGPSPEAFGAFLNGEADMVFMLRPSVEQERMAAEKGIEMEITPIAREAFVFFLSRNNPVRDLSSEQIRDVYSKKTVNWMQLGGYPQRILPFQRPRGSGSQTAMERFMGETELAPPVREEFQQLMGGIVNRVADYRNYGNSIGYSFRFYVNTMFKHDGVVLLSLDGVEPSVENIRSGKYPHIEEMVVITSKSQDNPNVRKILDWLLSPQGQELIEKTGYVPIR